MRTITMWLLVTVTVLVLLFSYRTSINSTTTASSAVSAVQTSVPVPPISVSPDTADSPMSTDPEQTTGATDPTSGASTVTGSAVDTRWGPVQVQITVADGKITSATVTQVPNGNGRDREINARAVPVLEQETVAAQSADIDMVSGATVTSVGYIQSLQSAIDQVNLG